MIIGFTGARSGMSFDQRVNVRELLLQLHPTEVRHGDCVGSDAQFHDIASETLPLLIVIHPPSNDSARAFCRSTYTRVLPALPYLERNKAIVNASDILIATPATATEELRSGTWSTIRYARKTDKRVIVIEPDGTVRDSGKEMR